MATISENTARLRQMIRRALLLHNGLAEIPVVDLEWAVTEIDRLRASNLELRQEIARLRYLLSVETDGEDCAAHDLQALDRTADGEVIYE